LFKIEDEITIADTSESLIVAKYMNETIDTFTLAEARLVEAQSGGRNPVLRAASAGLFGYFLGRSMLGGRPSAGAYVDQKTYDRVSKNAGSSMQRTASRTTRMRPSGKSGFGSGKSSRSFGG
ncbi:MAG: hypothetical protein AAFO94_15105, partial [Bacteroidota bacterium]